MILDLHSLTQTQSQSHRPNDFQLPPPYSKWITFILLRLDRMQQKKTPQSSRDSLGLIGYAVANAATRMSDKGQFQYLVGDNLI